MEKILSEQNLLILIHKQGEREGASERLQWTYTHTYMNRRTQSIYHFAGSSSSNSTTKQTDSCLSNSWDGARYVYNAIKALCIYSIRLWRENDL